MYYVYFDGLLLPTPPDKITTKINNQNKTVNLANEGEINILKRAGLTDINFDMRIFHDENPYTRDLLDVDDYLGLLEILKQSQKPFQFIVVRTWDNGKRLYDTNFTVSLEDYKIEESANDGNMTKIPIKLKQYDDYSDVDSKIEEVERNGEDVLIITQEPVRYTDKEIPDSVTAKAGQTLWDIAKLELNNGSEFLNLANLNNIDNPNIVFEGGEVIRFV